MRNVLVLLALIVNSSIASANAQAVAVQTVVSGRSALGLRELVAVSLDNVTIGEALRTVAKQADLQIVVAGPVLSLKDRVTLNMHNVTAEQALKAIMKGTDVTLNLDATGQIVFARENRKVGKSSAQGIVAGKVVDARSGKGVAGASVSIGNEKGVTTGEDGTYRLSGVAPGAHTVTVRLVGYAKQTRSVTVGEGATATVDFKLEPSANVLDQVVVTGTAVATELKAVPNAITVITAKQIEERGITRIDQLFRGDIPGLFAQNQGSRGLLDEVVMFSRGATSLGASAGVYALVPTTNPIKTYVDGVELADAKYISQIDPKTIERVEILTGPQASTIYGSNAINGVMQIFTKRGAASRPQLNLSLISGWVENNFSEARTPEHDYGAQLNGVEGRLSYNAGGSWNYVGPWTPSKQTTRVNTFGGTRFDLPTVLGRVTADVTLQRGSTRNQQRGSIFQTETGYRETGWYKNISSSGLNAPTISELTGETLALTLGYAPTNWWSHEIGIGQDRSDTELRVTERGYLSRDDTTLQIQQNHTDRRSLRYVTTIRLPMTSIAQATVTGGTDAWQSLTSSVEVYPLTLTGPLMGYTSVYRQPAHNAGSFLQTQIGVKDRLFLTYGLRAEWNPNFGEEASPNYAPRYGIAYTQEVGSVSAKLRGSYGRSTRPPLRTLKVARTAAQSFGATSSTLSDYGNFDLTLANPDLSPEYQQGGEGGLELYLGTLGSLVVTRYNQTVDGLISSVVVDSARSFTPFPPSGGWSFDSDGYGYISQFQNLNIGSIRNQGWELQGSINTGPVTTRGTYSWTKSRMIGITPKYRAYFASNPRYQPGAMFSHLPEHTWALGVTYARAQTTVALNMNGIGQIEGATSDLYYRGLESSIRLMQNRFLMDPANYLDVSRGYAVADFSASHRFASGLDALLQVTNLTDYYQNDFSAQYATAGRQTRLGVRWRIN